MEPSTTCLIAYVTVFFVASKMRRQTVNMVLLAALMGVGVHVTMGRDSSMAAKATDKVKKLELEAFQAFNDGKDDDAFKAMMDIQKIDPCNADVQYLTGLMAFKNENDGLPMIIQGANWGSGLAVSWLKDNGKEWPCNLASGGGTEPLGKR